MATRYLSEAELEARFGEARVLMLADRDGDGAADTGIVETAILEAESRADSTLLNRYVSGDLPTTPTAASPALKRVVAGLALWYLAGHVAQKGQDLIDAYTTAISELNALGQGRQSLVLTSAPEVDRARPMVGVTKVASDSAFSRAALEDW